MTSPPASPPAELTVSLEQRPASQVEVKVEAPAEELDGAVTAALRRLASRVRVPGFRPGKAPGPIVERSVGWEAVRRDALEHLLPDLLRRAFEQAGVRPVDEPDVRVETAERGQPLSLSAQVTVAPHVDLGDYAALRVEETATEVGEEQVDAAIEEVRRRHSELRPVERPAQAGDVIRCTLVMRRGDEVLSGSSERERDVELDRDKVLPGLVEGIIGLSAGESRRFEITLPDNFPEEKLRGVRVEVEVDVRAVRERVLPPLDDELAVKDGHGTTVDELRTHYRAQIEETVREHDEEVFRANALAALRDHVSVDVPELMVDQELDREVRELEMRLAETGMPLDRYLEYRGTSVEQLRGEGRSEARRGVRLQLALDALAEAEGVEIDESQVERDTQRLAEGRKLTAEQRRRLADLARLRLRRRAATERLLEIVRGQG